MEAGFVQITGDGRYLILVGIFDTDKHSARLRKFDIGRHLALDEGLSNVTPTPITSPVDFISGPRMVSTPGTY